MALEIGQRVGDYEVLSLLGAGGMGQVYSVRNVISGRVEAMKVLIQNLEAQSELASRFTVEIRTLAALEHPNIAQLRTAFQFENQIVMIMEFVEGTTLEKLVAARPILATDALNYSSQVLAALAFAHSKRVIHRDIKPANIMISSHGVAKLMDFGIARSSEDLHLTRTGVTVGSVYYMSPEQVRGDVVDARSDVYSFGVTLYQMLTGRRPFQGDNAYALLTAQLNENPVPPDQLNPTLPVGLSDVVLRAMAKAPESRYQSADEFREALLRVEKGLESTASAAVPIPIPIPVPAPPVPMPPVAQPPRRGQRGLWLGLGAAAAIVAMIAAITLLPRFMGTHASQTVTPAVTLSRDPALSTGSSNTATGHRALTGTPPAAPVPRPIAPPEVTPAPSQPVQVPARPVRPQYASSPAPTAPTTDAPPPGPSKQEMDEARTRLIQLDSRGEAARSSIETLRAQQQAQGYGLRGDIAGSLSRMNAYLSESNRALNAGDLQNANATMDRAEKELSTLETFLGR